MCEIEVQAVSGGNMKNRERVFYFDLLGGVLCLLFFSFLYRVGTSSMLTF